MTTDDQNTHINPENTQMPSQPKFEVAPDGKLYRVEADGSRTYMGYAGNSVPGAPKKPRKNTVLILIIAVLVILLGGILGFFFASSNGNQNAQVDTVAAIAPDTTAQEAQVTQQAPEAPAPVIAQPTPVVEQPAQPSPDELAARFLNDGHWVGVVAGKAVTGYMDFDTGEGWVYYNSIGPKGKMSLWSNGDSWEEYYDGMFAGTWFIKHTDFTKKNFMSGTYVRDRDGKSFSFTLSRQNF